VVINPMNNEFTPAARFILVAGAFVIIIAGMKAASSLLAPFLLAIFIAVIAAPPLDWLRRRGLPEWAALVLVVFGIIAIGGLVGALVQGALTGFTASLPDYQERLRALSTDIVTGLEGLGVSVPERALNTWFDPAKAMGIAGELVKGMSGVLANALLILLTVVFILFEATSLPAKLQAALKTPEASKQRLRHVMDSINQYMGIKTLTSLATGAVVWLMLTLLGVDFAILWAVSAFLLNFVPTIGSFIAAIPAVLLALVQLGFQTAAIAAVGYIIINTVIGNIVEPRVMGRGLGLSTLVVFVSLVFWGWVLGSVGMFLSVPLTMALKIALDAAPETRPLAIMLGPEIPAGDPPTGREDRA
jgi:predicted PurR-regulated permease PerM